MANALTSIKPHVVSTDLSGCSVMLYGTPKSGKTTVACQFPGSLLLAFEKGYNFIPGAMAIPVNSWNEFRGFLIDLADEETKAMYKTVIIDTADIAYEYCTDYICNKHDKESIREIGYGQGYDETQKEFDKCIRKILNMNYGLVLISHSQDRQETDENGQDVIHMMPTLDKRARLVCERTCDLIGLTRPVKDDEGKNTTRMYLRATPRYDAGARLKYVPDSIELSYENLVKVIQDGIRKEAEEHSNQFVSTEKINPYAGNEDVEYDFTALVDKFGAMAGELMNKDAANRTKITKIVNEYLGPNRKVKDCTEKDAGQIALIIHAMEKLI